MADVLQVSVAGMTCEHCAASVREELLAISTVTAVDVDLAAGLARIESSAPIGLRDVRAAVHEAGYELAS
jgi:copper chaperone